MPNLEELVSNHQLITYPALRSVNFDGSVIEARRFDAAYKYAQAILTAQDSVEEIYIVRYTYDDKFRLEHGVLGPGVPGHGVSSHFFGTATELYIGDGRKYQLTDIVVVVRRS